MKKKLKKKEVTGNLEPSRIVAKMKPLLDRPYGRFEIRRTGGLEDTTIKLCSPAGEKKRMTTKI